MSSMEATNLNIETLNRMFSEGKRFDKRSLTDFREIKVSYDVSNKAEGSARVKLGKTEVVAGVKLGVSTPYPDSPTKGNLMISCDLLPLASPRYEIGPPKFNAIELPRLVDRAIRESGMVKLDQLCIVEGEKVWTVMIDIYPINDDGNMIDAATMAAIAALKATIVPVVDENGKIDHYAKSDKKLPISDETWPLSITFFKLGNHLILDSTREEEEACDVRITWGISLREGQHMINSCQKSGPVPMTKEEIEKMMSLLPGKYDELSGKMSKFFSN